MHEYLFDCKLFASLRVLGRNRTEAEKKLRVALDCATIDHEIEGVLLKGEVSLDDGPFDLIEIDGEWTDD